MKFLHVYTFILFFIQIAPANTKKDIIPEKVIICGICKNVGSTLVKTIPIVEKIASLFSDYQIIIYENNSTDNTVKILQKWARDNNNITFMHENLSQEAIANIVVNFLEDKTPFRPELISRARNIVLEKAMSATYDDYPYIIWLDLDFKYEPHYDGIIETFTTTQEWDAVFAYGIDPNKCFWDWFALRDTIDPLGPELLGWSWYVPKKLTLSVDAPWYPVFSAFGGCGIYKKESIKGCHYSALVTHDLELLYKKIISSQFYQQHPRIIEYKNSLNHFSQIITLSHSNICQRVLKDESIGIRLTDNKDALVWRMNSFTYQFPVVCEHVSFHASMINNGHDKLFINPRLIFNY